jgi:N-acetylmuramoyl-L-alanine amidase
MSVLSLSAYHLGMLGEDPDWSSLDSYQESMSRAEFETVLDTLYLPYGYEDEWVTIFPGYALIKMNGHDPLAYYKLRFKPWGPLESEPITELSVGHKKRSSLDGLVIAIDPGHLGGEFSQMERRHFKIGEDPPVKEGDLTLLVSQKLKIALEDQGVQAVLVRSDSQPLTSRSPNDLLDQAEAIEQQFWLEANGFSLDSTPWKTDWFQKRVRARAEMLFYRVSEIQTRAEVINEKIQPDLTLAIHFNVSPWVENTHQVLPEDNHMHVIVHGTYTSSELALDDVRYHLFKKLLSRNHEIEIPMAQAVADSLAEVTGLPPFTYGGRNASNQDGNPYLWARNLLANRLYSGPVLFFEAYCSNSRETYQRIQLGDFQGLREVNGSMRPSLYAEYVKGIVEGLVDYYSQKH